MARALATYISLPGTTAEAMHHWHEIFGGELNIMTYDDVPMEGMPFEPHPGAVAHATLDFPGGSIAGSDVVDDKTYPIRDTAYSFLLTTQNADEARGYMAQLIDGGGSEAMPFEQAPWGGWYGQVFDQFGVMWAFSCDEDSPRPQLI
ncbi:VOC family protein [Enteractinococcus coprophilus]|uniref:PhnB protein n=1 Tax=Enteractinococcus coprophilus TaxID=1027633 RepID=A0A543AIH6_9MICC|nr:VOC family protein [Enteractinococcus coprophilus]TQL72380.1 PhnB protein [Enteractinococcus coprophilus]